MPSMSTMDDGMIRIVANRAVVSMMHVYFSIHRMGLNDIDECKKKINK